MKRHDFVLLFDVQDGNPNGDPDAGNLPRLDPETMHGLVSDVCLKRKVRDYVAIAKDGVPGYELYVKHRGILANEQKRAYEAVEAVPGKSPNDDARKWMCKNFFDVRAFGAVMTVGKTGNGAGAVKSVEAGDKGKKARPSKAGPQTLYNCGQVRGPVQLTFARSIDPVVQYEHSITRVALTNPGDVERGEAVEDGERARSGQMGRKATLPYGLYRAHGFVSPKFARDAGFSESDLALLWEALENLFEHDRSAARGFMNTRKLIIFKHASELGNAPAHRLFDCVTVTRLVGDRPPRSFADYHVEVGRERVPAGVEVMERP